MEFSIATLLSYLSDDKLIAAKSLKEKLGCEDEENAEKLQIALDALEKIGLLVKDRGKYRRYKAENVVEAKLRCSSKGFCFAIQDVEDADDIYVRESHLSHAWNGDRVLVKIIKEGSRRRSPEGEVVVILERANPSLLAQVKWENGQYRAIPLDDRLLFELQLKETGQDLEQTVDHLVHVSVLRYPIAQHPPLGQVTRVLGSDAEAAADTDIVCCKHDLPQAFPDNVLNFLQELPTSFDLDTLKQYQDLRSLFTFTIEDEYSPFVENAFTLEQLDDPETWQVGIHITDVAQYVSNNSVLDRAARKRGTTVHLEEKVLPLLPEGITERCSLVVGKDRLVISVVMNFTTRGDLQEYAIFPAVVQVDQQLTYQQVQKNLSEPEEEEPKLSKKLQYLFFTLSPLLKAQRTERGSFEIESETDCPYKDEGRLGAILVSSVIPVRSMLAEVMVIVGEIIARHLQGFSLPTLYCGQPEPDPSELEDLIKLGQNLELEVSLDAEEEITSQDYQDISRAFSRSQKATRVLNYLLQCTLKPVKYSSHPIPHFGLALTKGYTHCLSPGRRYADLFIQRVLKALFEQGKDRHSSRSKNGVNLGSSECYDQIKWKVLPNNIQQELEEQLHALVGHLNEREKLSEDAEKDLQGLKKAEKMKERTGQVFQGLITGVQSYGFFVELEDLLVEGLVHVSSLKDDWYEYRSRHSCLVGRKNRISYRLGDEVEVQVKSVDYYRQQIDLVTVSKGLENEDPEHSI